MILDKFPSKEEFYKTYWGKSPFVVRAAIDENVLDGLIDGDSLAGLSLEEDIKSCIVTTSAEGKEWTCNYGPFEEDRFSSLGDRNWSLLVQNVEQYHTDTAKLLRFFHFSPRWLMDDIMVSYSAIGGTVGSHTDSYHVFLVQGVGKRRWKIGHAPIEDEDYIENLDLKVLKNSFEGEEVEVSIGDVIYIPPHFAHKGITLEEAMTFSVGFLGPKISEMLVEYGHYLEQNARLNRRYSGRGLDQRSSAFAIDPCAQNSLQNDLVQVLQSDDFSHWMAEFFSTPSHDDIENIESRKDLISSSKLLDLLRDDHVLYRPEHIKLSITSSLEGALNLAVYGKVVSTLPAHDKLIDWLNKNRTLSYKDIDSLGDRDELMTIITHLYNQNVLFDKHS